MKKVSLFILIYLSSFFITFCQNNKPVDSTKIQQLAGLCKVWGFLKYYHPEIQKGNIDWDTTLIIYIPKILKAKNNEEFNKIINEFILVPGKVKKVNKPYKYLPKDTSYTNFDFEWIKDKRLFSNENSRLLFEVIENYKPRNNVYLKRELNKYYGENGYDKYYYINNYYPDTAHALLAMYRYWNVIDYFFAYKKITDEKWDNVLIDFIPKILESAGNINFYYTMIEMITKINDCHGYYENYNFNNEMGRFKSAYFILVAPLEVNYVENRTIISFISDTLAKETSLAKGDIILKINGVDADTRRVELKKYCGCSTQSSIEREINTAFVRYPRHKEISITATDLIDTITTDTFTNQRKYWYQHIDSMVKKLSSDIGYINLEYASKKTMRTAFKRFENSKALIFDLRNNAYTDLSPIALRLPKQYHKNVVYTKYCDGNLKYPGLFDPRNRKTFYLGLKLFHKQYGGQVVFLINENVQSTYEFTLMELKAANKITLIGNNTAGADGEAFSFLIQNNFLTYFTGDAVFNPDGSPTQRVGIKPDIYIVPTIKDTREGKDEVLDRAIEYLKNKK